MRRDAPALSTGIWGPPCEAIASGIACGSVFGSDIAVLSIGSVLSILGLLGRLVGRFDGQAPMRLRDRA